MFRKSKYISATEIKALSGSFITSNRNDMRSKVAMWRGDITKLNIDAIVNAANRSLCGGGGVDGAIHRAAGSNLLKECQGLQGCETGEAKITKGYNLPSKHVIHTVGPMGENGSLLTNCYQNSLDLLLKNKLRSIAFPCISTGIYGYPNEAAAHVALNTTRNWLKLNQKSVDLIIFCLFMPVDVDIYKELTEQYFPEHDDQSIEFQTNAKKSDTKRQRENESTADENMEKKTALESSKNLSSDEQDKEKSKSVLSGSAAEKVDEATPMSPDTKIDQSMDIDDIDEVAKPTEKESYGNMEKKTAQESNESLSSDKQDEEKNENVVSGSVIKEVEETSPMSQDTENNQSNDQVANEADTEIFGKFKTERTSEELTGENQTANVISDKIRKELIEKFERGEADLIKKLIEKDGKEWMLNADGKFPSLKKVGGLDISYHITKDNIACVSLVILSFPELELLHEDTSEVEIDIPYMAGYLAYRELDHYEEKISKVMGTEFEPQIVLVDGNGILHTRRFGSACQVGVVCNIPAIGVAKNLFIMPEFGIERDEDFLQRISKMGGHGSTIDIVTNTGELLGKALKSTKKSKKPIYVSIGHMCGIDTAVNITLACSKYRVPEPIRQADSHSRAYLQNKYKEEYEAYHQNKH